MPRTHRGKERFPGMTITYGLMERYEEIAEESDKARILLNTKVTKLLTDKDGNVCGCECVAKDGKVFQEHGPVIIATGGFGADFTADSLLNKYRPDLKDLPTTNGDHCTGDGLKMTMAVGGECVDLEWVQVHPTGLIHPEEPDAKVKFLAAEALRGVGGVLLDINGNRFRQRARPPRLRDRTDVEEQGHQARQHYRLLPLPQWQGLQGDRVALQALQGARDHEVLREHG
jgi:succinate dehydrogenase/fumarate reductase flavoprotein subunit